MSQKIRRLVLVLASQRSGSTLLCRDITSLGGLGIPKEHFLDILGKKSRPDLTEQDVMACLEKGRDPNSPDVAGVKLMVNYAPKIDGYIRGDAHVGASKAINNILNWARLRFDDVAVFALVRENSLDQAISRAVANATNIWHRNEAAVKRNDPYADIDLPIKELNMDILSSLPATVRQNQIIRQVARENPKLCRLISYENLAASVEGTSEALLQHASTHGFCPENTLAVRSLRKLIDEDRSKELKNHFRQFLSRQLGPDFFDF